MNLIQSTFSQLKEQKKTAFIAYVTAGDPDLATTEKLVPALAEAGADIIELGVPFSDPLADGPTIQAASQRALDKGTTLTKIFESVEKIRKSSQVPICLMSYFNPIFYYGEEKFVKKCRQVGVDGVIIPDLPPEEAGAFIESAKKNDLATIFFMSPTTREDRVKKVAKQSTGFIYYVSVTGVTGARKKLSSSYMNQIKLAKKYAETPVCVGFGISDAKQVKKVSQHADGVIVGSAIVNEILKNKGKKSLVANVAKFVKKLKQ